MASNLPSLKPKPAKDAPVKCKEGWRHKYGAIYDYPYPLWWIELRMWYERAPTGLDPITHLKNYFTLVHPECAWHEWRETMFRSLTDDEYVSKIGSSTIRNIQWVGAAAAGKTATAGDFAFAWWICEPKISTVILTSTSKGKIKQRVWPLIQSRLSLIHI